MIETLCTQNHQQNARAELREGFLRTLCELNGEPCNILTFEHSKLSGTFHGWKTDGAEVLVRGLQVPTGDMISAALLWTSDIISVEFENNIALPANSLSK